MIYDVRTYQLVPHAVPEVERRLAAASETDQKYSTPAASFHSEIGPLNQVIQIWQYESLAERDRISAEASITRVGQADISDFVVAEHSQIFSPFEFSPPLQPGNVGPFFEMRIYGYANGDRPKIIDAWKAALPGRLELGPIVCVLYSESESASTLLHIWPYRSLDERAEVRKRARETGLWPPLAFARKHGLPEYKLLAMENRIVMPSAFSPLR